MNGYLAQAYMACDFCGTDPPFEDGVFIDEDDNIVCRSCYTKEVSDIDVDFEGVPV